MFKTMMKMVRCMVVIVIAGMAVYGAVCVYTTVNDSQKSEPNYKTMDEIESEMKDEHSEVVKYKWNYNGRSYECRGLDTKGHIVTITITKNVK